MIKTAIHWNAEYLDQFARFTAHATIKNVSYLVTVIYDYNNPTNNLWTVAQLGGSGESFGWFVRRSGIAPEVTDAQDAAALALGAIS